MIAVSEDFKQAVRTPGNQRKAYVTDGVNEITGEDDLKYVKIVGNSALLRAVMRQAEVRYIGDHPYAKDDYLNIGIGVVLDGETSDGNFTVSIADPAVFTKASHGYSNGDAVRLSTSGLLPSGLLLGVVYYVSVINTNTFMLSTTVQEAIDGNGIATSGSQSGTHSIASVNQDTEYIDYGSFRIAEEPVQDQATDGVVLKLFDKMYEANQPYELDSIYDVTFPCTLGEFVQAVCTKLGWTLSTPTFVNDDIILEEDIFFDIGYTYRDVLDDCAEASASVIFFNVDDELVVRNISAESSLETLTAANLLTYDLKDQYGAVNAIVLSRSPQEDNIAIQDTGWTEENNVEIKIVNNLIVDSDRETHIVPISEELFGLTYHPFDANTEGLFYYEFGDRLTVENPSDIGFEVLVFDILIEFDGGAHENLGAKIPEKSFTNYDYAGVLGSVIKKVEIIVDKRTGSISLITEAVEELQSMMTQLQQTVQGINIQVQGVGGTNLLKNSSGLKGSLSEWQAFDASGTLLDARNTGEIVQTTDVQNNTESGSGIKIIDQYIRQTVPVVVGKQHVFYCRFKKNTTLTLSITGAANQDVTVDSYVNEEWETFKYSFTPNTNSVTVQLETTDETDYAIIADMVVKQGDTNGWVLAAGEVYGKNFAFDRSGLSITSPTNKYKAVLDNEKLTIFDTASGSDVVIMQIARDSATIKDALMQNSITLQKDTGGVQSKLIATGNGGMLIVND